MATTSTPAFFSEDVRKNPSQDFSAMTTMRRFRGDADGSGLP
jgi:hypothetical protein